MHYFVWPLIVGLLRYDMVYSKPRTPALLTVNTSLENITVYIAKHTLMHVYIDLDLNACIARTHSKKNPSIIFVSLYTTVCDVTLYFRYVDNIGKHYVYSSTDSTRNWWVSKIMLVFTVLKYSVFVYQSAGMLNIACKSEEFSPDHPWRTSSLHFNRRY